MGKVFKKQYVVSLPKRKNDEAEFGGGKKGIIICPECNCSYFKKSWHHNFQGLEAAGGKKNTPIVFKLCPADEMIKNNQFEGEVVLKNVPAKYAEELENLIIAYTKRAYERDPMDRLIKIKKNGSEWSVTVTENQLANKLAQKIKSSFRKVKSSATKFQSDPGDVARIKIEFKE